MNESDSIEAQNLNAIPMSDQTRFRLNEINKIKTYFNSEIQERKAISKILVNALLLLIMLTKFLLFCLHLLVLEVLHLMQQLL